ncbi:hypothetical protein QFZ37_003186 [Chryseobacterium ginsenosidimutans]|uniref:hypothetical protein n=1 Tax=Chryseobacterium ginsenosidimutans TaxID=687846 RepID=UPI0027887DD8|nr:hypothetical protein [Chryseobacterium ginsenosidimutans]MDQ0594817.1 hypothetical protein [Chryseobacterium ginsenosidimutans]
MKTKFFTIILFHSFLTVFIAQSGNVGINTSNPVEKLDVNGRTYTNSLYLRNPGEPTTTGGHFLATSDNNVSGTSLQLYDPTVGNSALFNYMKLVLTGVPKSGITDYDTKIDANNFLAVIHNYSFGLANGDSDVTLDYIGAQGVNDSKQGSPDPDIRMYKSNGTWHLKAIFTNSTLIDYTNNTSPSTTYNNFTLIFYIMVHKKLIAKQNIPNININLGGANGSSQSIPKPSGF